MTVFRTLVIVAALRQKKLSQLDVKNVFSNRYYVEEVCMAPSMGLPHVLHFIWKPRKFLCGLK